MDLILVAVISLGAIGLIAAVILYAASKKFAVYEDPRLNRVPSLMPLQVVRRVVHSVVWVVVIVWKCVSLMLFT